MQKEFQRHIRQHFPFLEHARLIIAISGGLDSVVLTHLCTTMNLDIVLAHCNFSLRGKDSDADEAHVLQLAEQLQLECFTQHFDTKVYAKKQKVSIQVAARELRYQWFYDLKEQLDFDYILTAHHADDVIETFFINLTRGTGLKGLAGIPSIHDEVIRPLLAFKRSHLLIYAQKNELSWREDQSNRDTKYTRNYLRHDVLPGLFEVQPDAQSNILKTISHLDHARQLMDFAVVKLFDDGIISEAGQGLEIHIDKLLAAELSGSSLFYVLQSYGFTAWDDVTQLVNAQTGKYIDSQHWRLIKNRNLLVLQPKVDQEKIFIQLTKDQVDIELPNGKLHVAHVDRLDEIHDNTCYVDQKKIDFPLHVRSIKEGDRFQPFGLKGTKKVSKFLKDSKKSHFEKQAILVLCNADDEIIWLIGERADDRFKVDDNTTSILQFTHLDAADL